MSDSDKGRSFTFSIAIVPAVISYILIGVSGLRSSFFTNSSGMIIARSFPYLIIFEITSPSNKNSLFYSYNISETFKYITHYIILSAAIGTGKRPIPFRTRKLSRFTMLLVLSCWRGRCIAADFIILILLKKTMMIECRTYSQRKMF